MFSPRLRNIGESIFARMTALANKHNAVNLSQGFPDFSVSGTLIDLIHRHMQAGANQYAPMPGLPALRNAISEKIRDVYGREYNPDTSVTITAGATQAIFTAINSIISAGDEVIVFEPAYDSYIPSILIAGGIPVPVSLNQHNFTIDWEAVESAVTSKTKAIVLNSPHNPCGTVFTTEDIEHLRWICSENDIYIISDEVYEHMVFDGGRHHSIAEYEDLAAKAFVISSFGKTYHATGWKVGYAAAPPELTKEFRKVHQFVTFSVHTPTQAAYAEFMQHDRSYNTLSGFYQKKRDYLNSFFAGSPLKFTPAEGTYFQIFDYSAVSDEHDLEFSERLTREAGVAVIPLSPFFSKDPDLKFIRVCFAKRDEVIKEGAERLLRYIHKDLTKDKES